MNKAFVWVVSHVTGYTSEAETFLFHNEKDALEKFNAIAVMFYEHLEQRKLEVETLLELNEYKRWYEYDVKIEDRDITWDNGEVYERVFMYKSEVL